MLLLDPVSLMLQEPDVAHNFLYRDPDQGSAVQAFFKYFVATELHVRAKLSLHDCTHETACCDIKVLVHIMLDPECSEIFLPAGCEYFASSLLVARKCLMAGGPTTTSAGSVRV